MGDHRLARVAPALILIFTVAVNAWVLRPETVPVHQLNDSVMHESMVRWARHEIDAGKTPLDGWYPYLSLGSPQFHHYPTLSHVVAGYGSKAVGVERAYRWSLYLLLASWPLALFWAARLFGWDRWTAALTAAVR